MVVSRHAHIHLISFYGTGQHKGITPLGLNLDAAQFTRATSCQKRDEKSRIDGPTHAHVKKMSAVWLDYIL